MLGVVACEPADPLPGLIARQEQGDYAGTIEPLRALLEERPDDPEVQYHYGISLLTTGQQSLAIWPLRRSMENEAWLSKAALPLAASFIGTGAYDDAIETTNQVLEAEPDNVNALLVRADAQIRSRRFYEEALADVEKILEIDPDNTLALVPRAVALLALERTEEAGDALAVLEESYRDDSLGLHGNSGMCAARATFAKEKGELAKADEIFADCLERFPSDGIVIKEASAFYDSQGRPERTQEVLEEALEADPSLMALRSNLAIRLRAEGKTDEAIELLREGTNVPVPDKAAEAWAAIAAFHVEQEDYAAAVSDLENARRLDRSENKTLELTYADVLALAGQFDEALRVADGFDIPAYQSMVRGRVALERDQPAEALRYYYEGVRLWPDNPIARYYAAIAAERVGDFARAVEDYRYAMRIDAKATDAHLRLARLHRAAGRYDLALSAVAFQSGGREAEFESGLFELETLGQMGRLENLPQLEKRHGESEHWGAMVAALADGVAQTEGPEAAIALIEAREDVQLASPTHVAALDALSRHLIDAGKADESLKRVEAALAANPGDAHLKALQGRSLRAAGRPESAVREAFEAALASDSEDAVALRGLAELDAAGGNVEGAMARYDALIAAHRDDLEAPVVAARLLAEAGRTEDAEATLKRLLDKHPYVHEAASRLAALRVARGAEPTKTLELARRAVFFGGGAEAEAFLATLVEAEPSESPEAG